MGMVPIIAPDGSTGEVPVERLQDAIGKGAKPAVWMKAPDGSNGIVPRDRTLDAMKSGGRPFATKAALDQDATSLAASQAGPKPYYGFTPTNIVKNLQEGITGVAKGTYELGKDLVSNPNWVSGKDSTLEKFVINPANQQVEKAAAEPNKVVAGGRILASAVPLAGPWAASLGEQAGSGDVGGAISQTAGVIGGAKAISNVTGAASELPRAVGADAAVAGAPILTASAAKNLEQVLGATKEKMKAAATEHVVPGIMERGMTAMSRDSLLKQADKIVEENGPKVDHAIKAATATGVEFPTKPLIDKLESIRENHVERDDQGNITATRPAAMKMVDDLQETLGKYGDSMSPRELAGIRRFWDEDIANSTKGHLLDQPAEGLQVKRAITNAIRGTINDNLPEVAAANKEYSFGKDLQTVLEATQQRTASQLGTVSKIARALRGGGLGASLGAGIGTALGGPEGAAFGAAAGGIAGHYTAELVDSSAWKTVSSALKVKIANALQAGDIEGAKAMSPPTVRAAITQAIKNPPASPEQPPPPSTPLTSPSSSGTIPTAGSQTNVPPATSIPSPSAPGEAAADPFKGSPHPVDETEAARQLSALHKIASGNATQEEINIFFKETGIARSDLARARIQYAPKTKTGTNE